MTAADPGLDQALAQVRHRVAATVKLWHGTKTLDLSREQAVAGLAATLSHHLPPEVLADMLAFTIAELGDASWSA